MINLQLTKNFNACEFFKSEEEYNRFLKLPSNVQELYLSNILKVSQRLELFRAYKRKPINISSGWRSQELNQAVGGAKNSFHLSCMASDIWYGGIDKEFTEDFYQLKTIFGGVLYYPSGRFFHCDIRSVPYYNINFA